MSEMGVWFFFLFFLFFPQNLEAVGEVAQLVRMPDAKSEEFRPEGPHGGKRDLTSVTRPLTFIHVSTMICTTSPKQSTHKNK